MTSRGLPFDGPMIDVVVSCKSRKTRPIPRDLMMSSVRADDLSGRVTEWTQRITNSRESTTPAMDLYAGDHWKVVLGIPNAHPTARVRMWIASAGYGLVSFGSPLKPYTATFVRSHQEAVARAGDAHGPEEWWDALSEWQPFQNQPRRIAQLARRVQRENGFLLLALSAPYALALAGDISEAAAVAADRLALICAGLASSHGDSRLQNALVPAEARLKKVVGGAMQGVNARIARRFLELGDRWYPSTRRLARLARTLVSNVGPLEKYDRTRMTDVQVKDFITRRIAVLPNPSKTLLLRELRDSGSACEQQRFGSLYKEVTRSQLAGVGKGA